MASPSYVALSSTVDDSSSNATMKFSRNTQDTQAPKQQQEVPNRFSKKMVIASTTSLLVVLALVVCVVLPSHHAHANIMSSSGYSRTSTISDSVGSIKADALVEHLEALDYMEKKRQDDKPFKKSSLRSSSMVTKGGQLDPLLSKEDLQEFTFTVVSTEEDEGDVTLEGQVEAIKEDNEEDRTEEKVDDEVIKNEAALEEHLEALGYVDQKRQKNSQKKSSVRSSSVITKDQLDPLLAKEELEVEEAEYMNVNMGKTEKSSANHVDALAYMDEKRQNERPKKTSLRASSMITKDQLDPVLTKEDLETVVIPFSEAKKPLSDHVDALAYMDKKHERPKKSSLRASSMITKNQVLDPLLAKEELSLLVEEEDEKDKHEPVFEVVVEDPIENGQTQRRTQKREEEEEKEAAESDKDSNDESKDESNDESKDESSSDNTTTSSSDESEEVTEEFLENHQWSEKDFKVIDFTTEDYETVDLNRIGGGE